MLPRVWKQTAAALEAASRKAGPVSECQRPCLSHSSQASALSFSFNCIFQSSQARVNGEVCDGSEMAVVWKEFQASFMWPPPPSPPDCTIVAVKAAAAAIARDQAICLAETLPSALQFASLSFDTRKLQRDNLQGPGVIGQVAVV